VTNRAYFHVACCAQGAAIAICAFSSFLAARPFLSQHDRTTLIVPYDVE
jgi:hypothetical protein